MITRYCCYLLGCLCILVAGPWTFAQDFDLQLGPEYKDESNTWPPDILGSDANSYYVFQSGFSRVIPMTNLTRERLYLRKFNRQLTPTHTEEIRLKNGRKSEDAEFAVMLKGNLFLFSSFSDWTNRSVSLYTRKVDTEQLAIPERGTDLTTVSFDGYPKDKAVSFNYQLSRDSSKMLLYYQLPNKPDAPERFKIHLLTEDLTQLWEQEFELPYEEELFRVGQFRVDNEGQVYVLGREYFEKPKLRRKGEPNYQYKLLLLRPGDRVPEEMTLNLDGKFLVDMQIGILRDRNVICAGVYAEEKPQFIKGVYSFVLDAAHLEMLRESSQELSLDLFADEEEENQKKKDKPKSKRQEKKEEKRAKRAFINYEFDDMILRSDGGVMLVAEASFMTSSSYYVSNGTNGGSWQTRTIFHHNDLIGVQMAPDGNIERATRIPKQQRTSYSNYLLSYALAVTGSKVRFIFNDNIKNLALEPGNAAETYVPSSMGKAKQVIAMVTLNYDGTYKRKALVSTKEAEQFAVPRASIQTNSREIILVFQKRKKRRLARVLFTD
ncbi:MAG: hypothetical protein AAF399_12655 [Bacteroidota bacterium]